MVSYSKPTGRTVCAPFHAVPGKQLRGNFMVVLPWDMAKGRTCTEIFVFFFFARHHFHFPSRILGSHIRLVRHGLGNVLDPQAFLFTQHTRLVSSTASAVFRVPDSLWWLWSLSTSKIECRLAGHCACMALEHSPTSPNASVTLFRCFSAIPLGTPWECQNGCHVFQVQAF